MPIETYTYVGFQVGPANWILPALLLVLIPISRYRLRRIIPGAVVVPLFGFLLALIGVPAPYNLIIDMLAMSFVAFTIVKQAPSTNEPKTASLVPMIIVMAILLPNAVYLNFRAKVVKSMKLSDQKIEFVSRSKTVEIPRSAMRIQVNKTWGQDFSDGGENTVTLDDCSVYWDGESLKNGGDIAKRIAEWSGAPPAHSGS